jgi:topoisomerase IA-like protein
MNNNSDNVLGKINKKKCYLNEGKYGHYLTHDGKNYKVPEWFPVEKFDIDIAIDKVCHSVGNL